ncbi:1-acyl-sn-glycerol-3-phosphate acyltransferase [Nocardia sp. NBC_01503]|uniref:lysophospholipid acyltransferase family protein n=1 Tax=Nocardia sp. NBC_01503 TaxID=2975997 RepID=UPI002E7AC8B7|nr:lysophospholipid acyltransferase family protein [Nocardia sp. NBC_01503]WTL32999.1 1-acyl-sn-glycerol-3-phosphate acyltransferase [Nocardia sp. NBC_01503]
MMPAFLSPGSGALECPPAPASAHAWMPSSPCGPECVETEPEAGRLRFAARLAGIGAVAVSFPVAYLATPRRYRAGLQTRYARALLSCCGIRVRVVDRRAEDAADSTAVRANAAAGPQGLLVVAGHIGWTDIIALSAVRPTAFVARADMVDWPVLGDIARRVRVIPIDRERLRELPGVVNRIAERLASGERIGLFPEGTTWCGRAHGRLRPALFQAAIDTGTPVQPIRLRYLDRHGEVCAIPGFVGVDTMADSFRRVLRSKGVVAELVLQPLEQPGTDRRDLARRCEQAIRGDAVDRAFADIVGRDEPGSDRTELTVQAPEHRHPKLPARV